MYAGTNKKNDEARTRVKPHVKKGDTVLVLAGKDRGKQGKVLRVIATKGTAIVERVNFLKKSTRPNPQKNIQGGVLEREAPIQMSNLQLICPSCGKPSRTGTHRTEDGAVRYCKSCDTEIGK
jgi:large subunit ribosomal protein L24